MTIKGYFKPSTLKEASALLKQGGNIVVAGGTDVMIKVRRGAIRGVGLVNIKAVDSLSEIREQDGGLFIGSGVKLSAVASDERVLKNYPALAEGAMSIGTPQIRNLGTIGGNVCNASPCADTAPGLLVSGAEVLIEGTGGSRSVNISEFWTGPGKSVLEPGEIVTGFLLPTPEEGLKQGFLKLGPRRAADIAVVNLGISFVLKDGKYKNVRIALGSVAPTPISAVTAEAIMEGCAVESLDIEAVASAAERDSIPISDVRASEWYRKEAVCALVKELLRKLTAKRGE